MAAICVFCSSSRRIEPVFVEVAEAVGTEIARRGHELVSGGGRLSCMGAVARAARAGGARTIGVMPEVLVDMEVADHDSDELVVTPDMRSRKSEMDRRADAFLCLPGGLGTLEELLEIWEARALGVHAKPIVVLDAQAVFAPLRTQVETLVSGGFVRPEGRDVVQWATTAAEALDLVDAALSDPTPARAVVPVAEELLESEP